VAATRGYLLDLDAGDNKSDDSGAGSDLSDRLTFQFNPDKITRGVGVLWTSQQIPGHSHPRQQGVAGTDRTWEFSLKFHLDDDNSSWVRDRLDWLESLTLFEYDEDGNQKRGPHRVLYVMGSWIREVCTVQHFRYTVPEPLDQSTLEPRIAEIPLVLKEFRHQAVDWRDKRR